MQTRAKRVASSRESPIQPIYPTPKRALYDGDPASNTQAQVEARSQEEKQQEEASTQPSFEVLVRGESLDLNKKSYDDQSYTEEASQSTRIDSRRATCDKECPPAQFVQASSLVRPRVQTSPRSIGFTDSAPSGEIGVGERLAKLEYDISSIRIDIDVIIEKINTTMAAWEQGGRNDSMLRKLWSLWKFIEDRQMLPNRQWFSDPEVRRAYFNNVFPRTAPAPPRYNGY